jgi:hypothetical protein
MSQVDLALLSGAATAGADLTFGGMRAGIRYGAGPFASLDGLVGCRTIGSWSRPFP